MTSVFSFLYVLAPNATSVDVLALNGPGQAKQVSKLNFGAAAHQFGVPIGTFCFETRTDRVSVDGLFLLVPLNLQGMTHFMRQ